MLGVCQAACKQRLGLEVFAEDSENRVHAGWPLPVPPLSPSRCWTNSRHWFTTSFFGRKVPESDARSVAAGVSSPVVKAP